MVFFLFCSFDQDADFPGRVAVCQAAAQTGLFLVIVPLRRASLVLDALRLTGLYSVEDHLPASPFRKELQASFSREDHQLSFFLFFIP